MAGIFVVVVSVALGTSAFVAASFETRTHRVGDVRPFDRGQNEAPPVVRRLLILTCHRLVAVA